MPLAGLEAKAMLKQIDTAIRDLERLLAQSDAQREPSIRALLEMLRSAQSARGGNVKPDEEVAIQVHGWG